MQISLDLHTATDSELQSAACAIAEEITNRLNVRYDMDRDVWVRADSLLPQRKVPPGAAKTPAIFAPLSATRGSID
jgi:hypothetical protein